MAVSRLVLDGKTRGWKSGGDVFCILLPTMCCRVLCKCKGLLCEMCVLPTFIKTLL